MYLVQITYESWNGDPATYMEIINTNFEGEIPEEEHTETYEPFAGECRTDIYYQTMSKEDIEKELKSAAVAGFERLTEKETEAFFNGNITVRIG